jgi:putative FmdB family regulatory protein
MAVYEYLCSKCRNEFELMRPISEAEKPAKLLPGCPQTPAQYSGVESDCLDTQEAIWGDLAALDDFML